MSRWLTTFPETGTRIMLFAGRPATEGPGVAGSNELKVKEPVRFHHDRNCVAHLKCATKVCPLFYVFVSLLKYLQLFEASAKQNSNNGHVVDLLEPRCVLIKLVYWKCSRCLAPPT